MLSLERFNLSPRTKNGYVVYCRECEAVVVRKSRLKVTYGITQEQYDEMLEAQGGVCAICGGEEPKKDRCLSVDHDHGTDKVRGLLCGPCNRALGLFRDSPVLLTSALAYLRREALV